MSRDDLTDPLYRQLHPIMFLPLLGGLPTRDIGADIRDPPLPRLRAAPVPHRRTARETPQRARPLTPHRLGNLDQAELTVPGTLCDPRDAACRCSPPSAPAAPLAARPRRAGSPVPGAGNIFHDRHERCDTRGVALECLPQRFVGVLKHARGGCRGAETGKNSSLATRISSGRILASNWLSRGGCRLDQLESVFMSTPGTRRASRC
jgi:hypothetical protein